MSSIESELPAAERSVSISMSTVICCLVKRSHGLIPIMQSSSSRSILTVSRDLGSVYVATTIDVDCFSGDEIVLD